MKNLNKFVYVYFAVRPSPSDWYEDVEEGDHESSLGASEQVTNDSRSYGGVTGFSCPNQGPRQDQNPELL